MKILVLDGCPRKGNTWAVVSLALEQIKRDCPNAEIEEIILKDEKLPFCLGCSNCFRLGNDKCPHYGIVGKIIEKIETADGVIVCSTTYNWRETSILKNLTDHLCFMLHRPHFYKGKALIITTTGGTGGEKSAKSISSTLLGIGFNRCYNASFATCSWNAYMPNEKTRRKVSKITSKFLSDVKSGRLHSPSLMLLMPYNIMRGMGQHYTEASEYPTEDGRLWSSEERKKYAYFPQIKLPIYKKLFGNMFYGLGKMLGGMKFMQVTYKKNNE